MNKFTHHEADYSAILRSEVHQTMKITDEIIDDLAQIATDHFMFDSEANQAVILEILAGGQPQDPAPATPYCGNPESKILHKSSHWCGTGAVPFKTKEEAVSAGYRPCGICKP